jgi:lipid II:glycine glycyltransferase (peptidoglycan interpeptide bridge formation enzyme)
MKLFMAELAGRPLCGLMVVTMGSWARAWRIGWSGDEPKSYPTQAVYWAAIQWAQSAGYRYFDVTGLDERDAREILNGRPADAPFHCSITQFKIGFGGTVRVLPGEYCYFPNPVFRWMFNRLAPVWAGR